LAAVPVPGKGRPKPLGGAIGAFQGADRWRGAAQGTGRTDILGPMGRHPDRLRRAADVSRGDGAQKVAPERRGTKIFITGQRIPLDGNEGPNYSKEG